MPAQVPGAAPHSMPALGFQETTRSGIRIARLNRASPEWQVVGELRKQYDVVEILPASPIDDQLDALVVVLPSRLSQSEMDLVEARIKRGTPTKARYFPC